MWVERTAIIGGDRKAWYTGQGKMNFGQGKMNFCQGKVSENSGNFISDKEWAPCVVEARKTCLNETVHLSTCNIFLTLYLLVSYADNLCQQFGPRSGPTKRWA